MISAMTALALDKVTFIPQWTAQAQFAGYFVAKEKGFYAEEGLDVTIEFPSNSISTMTLLKEGQCQFTTTQLLDAICAADQGTDLVNILQTSQQSGLVLVGYNGKNPETLDKGDKEYGAQASRCSATSSTSATIKASSLCVSPTMCRSSFQEPSMPLLP